MSPAPTMLDRLRRARVPLLLIVLMVAVLVGSYGYEPSARALPVLVAWTTLGLLILEVLVQAGTPFGRRLEAFLQGQGASSGREQVPLGRALIHAVVWPGLLVIMTVVIGILPAVMVYVTASLTIVGGKPLPRALLAALAVTVFAWVLFEWGMSYQLYRGVLMDNAGF